MGPKGFRVMGWSVGVSVSGCVPVGVRVCADTFWSIAMVNVFFP